MRSPRRVSRLAILLVPFLLPGCGGGSASSGGTGIDTGTGFELVNGRPVPRERTRIDLGKNVDFRGLRLLPDDSAWNTPIDDLPVDPRSDTLLQSIGLPGRLFPCFGTTWEGLENGISYVVVGGGQPRVQVTFDYADESDPGPYPVPANAPIEGGAEADGDRHVLVVDRDDWRLYELFSARQIRPNEWHAGSGAVWDLATGAARPMYWTSADAAGLPILPGLVRYDEAVGQGVIRHALRFTAPRTRRAFVAPASHWASSNRDESLPPMGLRVRLKASYAIPADFPAEVRAILQCLKTYGMILADNGSPWYVTGAHDPRWDDDRLGYLKRVTADNLAVVQMGECIHD
jgi:hypothetical protein